MKKLSLILTLALLAFTATTWAQEVTVSSEEQLRYFLNSNSTYATLTDGALITLTGGELVVDRAVTINLGNRHISGGDNSRIFKVTANGNLTLTGSSYLTNGSANTDTDNTNGGIIYNAGTVTISGGMGISYGQATNGGAIYNTSTGTLILNGGNISHCEATNGGAIYNAGTLTINEGTIGITDSPNTASNKGGGIFSTGTLTISGGSIRGNKAGNGAAINLNGGIFTMTGGTISGNSTIVSGNANKKCGGVNLTGGSTMTMSGGSIADNTSLDDDGGVYIGSDCTFTMTGGSITGNSAKNYGGIQVDGIFNMSGGSISGNTATESYGGLRVNGSGTFNMTGGSVSGNTATNHGGIYVNGTLTMTGGSVTGNSATNNYGGIYVNGTLNMSGRPIVMGNLANDNSSNVYLPSNKTITVDDAFTTGANVGITCAGGVNTIFTSGFGTNSPNNQTVFSSDNTAYVVMVYTNEAKLVDYSAPTISDSNVPYLNVLEDGDHGTAYRELCIKMSDKIADNNPTLTQASASEGWYVVDQNLTFNKRITISGTVNLILMDNTTLTANKGIHVPYGATLHIWAQSNKVTDPNDLMGVINATANTTNYSGIGGNNDGAGAGELHFHGGFVSAIGGVNAAGINGYQFAIGSGSYSTFIYGGVVFGFGGDDGAGIGCGLEQICGGIKITGGVVLGNGGTHAAGIGSGNRGKMHKMDSGYSGNPDGSEVTEIRITGGTVFGYGTLGAGIGGGLGNRSGYNGDPALVYIDGGTVYATTMSARPSDQFHDNSMYMLGACAIGWGEHGPDGYNFVHIYDGAKVLATTTFDDTPTLQTAANSRGNNWRRFKEMRIEPCDHPGYTPITYTDNGSSLSVNCDYCYTKEPYTFQSAGNWNDANHWLGNFTPGNGKNVAVKAAATIPNNYCAHVDTINMLEGGSLTINDGGQLIHSNAGVTATVQKSIIGHSNGSNGGWNFVASPLTESFAPTAGNGFLTNTYDLYFYEESTHYWRNFKPGNQASGFSIEPQQGYLYANSGGTMLQFNGTLQPNTEVTIGNLSQSASTLTGFNLVGNPFAHNVTTYTGTNVSAECFRLNDTRSEVVVGTIDAEHPLLPAEGFFVKATGADASITFNAQTRGTAVTPARISLELVEGSPSTGSGTALIDRLIVKREGEPLEKLTIRDGGTRLFALRDSQEMAVVIAEGNEQPVSFKAAQDGTYTLTVQVEGMELGYLHLIDNLTGNDVDLLQTPSYTFESNANDYASRFRLVFTADEDNLDNTDNFAFVSNGNIIIKGGPSTSSGTLQIVDVTGRIVAKHSGRIQCVPTAGMASGVYVLRLIDGNSVRTQKMVIE